MENQRTITLVSHSTVDFINDLKLVSLYYDKVHIPGNLVVSGWPSQGTYQPNDKGLVHIDRVLVEHPYIDEHYRSALSILEKAGIVEVKDDLLDHLPGNRYAYPSINSILELYQPGYTINLVRPDGTLVKVPEMEKNQKYQIHGEYVEELMLLDENFQAIEKRKQLDENYKAICELTRHTRLNYHNDIDRYILTQMNRTLRYITEGKPVLTTSEVISNFVKEQLNASGKHSSQKNSLNVNLPKTSIDLLKIHLPNISRLSIEDILEAKFRIKDELLGFNQKMKELEYELSRIDIKDFNATQYLNKFVLPQIDDLSRKMKSIDLGLGTRIINELRNPLSYSPLLLSITDIPQTLLVAGSLGLISASSILEYSKSKLEVKGNGFHYLLKLRGKL